MFARLVGLFALLSLLALPTPPAMAQVKKAPPLSPKIAAQVKAIELQVRNSYMKGKLIVTPFRAKLLKLHAKAWGKNSPHLAPKVFEYASALMSEMKYAEAQPQYLRAAKLFEKLYGRKHEQVATALQMIGIIHFVVKDHAEADRYMREATEIREQLYGADSIMYATYLQVWAGMLQGQHSYQKAEDLHRRSIAIIEKLKGPNDSMLISGLMQLGWLYYVRGDFKRGDTSYLRAVDIQSKVPGSTPGSLAQHWVTIGQLNHALGRPDKAKIFYDRAESAIRADIERLSKKHGVNSPDVDRSRHYLATLLMATNRLDAAKKIMLELKKKATNPLVAVSHNWQLATIATEQRNYDEAIGYYREVLKAYKSTLGSGSFAGPLSMMALAYRLKGDFKKALKTIGKVRTTYAKSFGAKHPMTLTQSESEAITRVLMGQTSRGVKLLAKVHAMLEPHTANILAAGTEADNRQYLASIAYQMDAVLTIHQRTAPTNADAMHLAMQMILQRKGRVLDAVTDIFGAMRKRMTPTDRKLLDQLRAARSKLSQLVIGGLGKRTPEVYQKELSAAETEVRRLEGKIRARNSAYKAATTPITVQGVAKAIPKGGTLVEYIAYRESDLRGRTWLSRKMKEHYAAYVLDETGTIQSVDLGPRKTIDALIGKLRKALADPNRDDTKALAQKVYTLAFKPVEALLGQSKRVILSPDAATNLVPFAALVDDRGQFLVKRFLFSYVSSGRDLVRVSAKAKATGKATIIANPNFDAGAKKAPAKVVPNATRGRLARALRNAKWKPLPGTGIEADAVAAVLRDAVLKTGEEATEAALKALKSPRILHVATHGFFLPHDRKLPMPQATSSFGAAPPGYGGMVTAAARAGNNKSTAENPLLRSGLALGGANILSSGNEDGVLTALEASDLDLWGTQLVVLSACETGVGEVRAGDGVHGLRRALVIAGAQSLVMSLWQVDDEATKQLMISYYKALENGKGRAEALRQVQLKMLRKEDFAHPFFWAAFIPAGRWQPLSK